MSEPLVAPYGSWPSPVTPRMLRVTFSGPELEGFATGGPATHIKVFLPLDDEREPLLPSFGPQGKNVAGLNQIIRQSRRIGHGLNGSSPVGRADPG